MSIFLSSSRYPKVFNYEHFTNLVTDHVSCTNYSQLVGVIEVIVMVMVITIEPVIKLKV